MPRNNNAWIVSGIMAGLLAASSISRAHPVHATFSEAAWNPITKSIEVALRIRSVDLEKTLSKGRAKAVDLKKSQDVDSLIRAYLEGNFTLTLPDKKILKPKWSDKEVGLINTWLYFEFPLEKGQLPANCSMSNTVFFNDFKGQKNVTEFRVESSRKILTFTSDQKTQPLGG
ncbi:MAG: hypothetical protein GY899_00445 [Verrucomicrobiaceae bacterium]|nr:hypothetical protein [Verrucomicrobiaceae bacterium]